MLRKPLLAWLCFGMFALELTVALLLGFNALRVALLILFASLTLCWARMAPKEGLSERSIRHPPIVALIAIGIVVLVLVTVMLIFGKRRCDD